jgi:hypothetical protein
MAADTETHVISPEEKGELMAELGHLNEASEHIEQAVGELSERITKLERTSRIRHKKVLKAIVANQKVDDEQDRKLNKLTKKDLGALGGLGIVLLFFAEMLRPAVTAWAQARGLMP